MIIKFRGKRDAFDGNDINSVTHAAMIGDAEARFLLYKAYSSGGALAGGVKDDIKADYWLKKAAEAGHSEAKEILDVF